MKYLKEMQDFLDEYLRKYENGEIPREPWEDEPPSELHLFKFRLKTTPPPKPSPESSGKE